MDQVEGKTKQTWKVELVETIDQLDCRISELRKRAGPKGCGLARPGARGMAA